MKRISSWAGSLVLLLLAGCSSLPARGAAIDPRAISIDEIAQSGASTAYDAIKRIRPLFLSFRGETTVLGHSSPYPTVWVDGIEYGSIESLRGIPSSDIYEIRLFRASIPVAFGSRSAGGVIAVRTRR